MKPLRIALVRQRYTAFGGAERFVERALQALTDQNAQLTLVTRRWASAEKRNTIICAPPYIGSLWRDWAFARCVCRTLKEQHFDLVQSHERIACCDIYRAGDGVHREWLEQRRRTVGLFARLSLTLNPYHHYVMAAEQKLFQSSQLKAVICNSHMVKDEILRYFDIPEQKLHVIYSGIDGDIFHPGLRQKYRSDVRNRYGIPAEAPLFLFVGSGFDRKGLPALLEAMSQCTPTAHLMVVGKDKKIKAFRARATALGLHGRIHLLGGQDDVKPFYGAADALVLPTLYDPFPNVALEAMATGLPVVTSTKCGAAEIIEPGISGFVVDALDVRRLSEHMDKLSNPGVSAAMGAAARERVQTMTLGAMGQQLARLYQTLV
jgi:UDP-glucose:(heptosyl)LPS alpha-1,3-glucosyltransferase